MWAWRTKVHLPRQTAQAPSRFALRMPLTLLIVVSSLSLVPEPGPAVATSIGVPLPAVGVYLGSWVQPREGQSRREALVAREQDIGRIYAIDHQYYRWDSAIPTAHEVWTADAGRIPFVSWNARRNNGTITTWSRIASGAEDAWIAARADAFRAFARPVYLSFHHEPEDDVPAFGQPSDFVAAFRHIVDIFRARGAGNVTFVWTMMAWWFEDGAAVASRFYPGDSYVDVVAADGYNWYPGKPGSRWRSFESVMQSAYAFAEAHGKPFMAAEYGVQEDPAVPGRKGDWYREILSVIDAWPHLIAVVYFDSDKIYPWMPDTSASALAGYRELASSARTAAMLGYAEQGTSSSGQSTYQILRRNSFEGGIAGGPITVESSGGANGDAFDALVVRGHSSLRFDDAAPVGSLSARHTLNGASASYYVWNVAVPAGSRWYGRVYLRAGDSPAGRVRLVRARSSGALRMALDLLPSGALRMVDGEGTEFVLTDGVIPTDAWIRLQWSVDQASGEAKIKVYEAFSDRPLLTAAGVAASLVGSGIDQVRIGGQVGSRTSMFVLRTDEPALSLTELGSP